ncbi:D-alanyl-D-alanine carboxypeptidase family protein [Methyloceanibacter sp.]|jgi:D-alanyl-D-alanine carboxypeptidase (penicillin-binding protein 5/6)|uniref:D-alanyl-D-alanine carboxypeptidase family protein n=1 Tax=Methyloceanibacter sp. TaxID=1965321 RepID=UPI003C75BB64
MLIKLAVAFAVLAAGATGLSAPASAATKAPAGVFDTKAKHAILMNVDADLIFYEKDADTLMSPASMSKLMTLAVVFRELKAGHIKLDDQFKVSEHAWREGGAPSGSSAMFAPLNSTVSVEDLIRGVTVQSGNDACIILAEGISGSEDAFVKEMNKYAKEIGLTKSHFENSTGLPADGHVMTARELALLADYLIKNYPEYYHYFGEKEFVYGKWRFTNRNPLVFEDLGVDGLKTGFIEDAGYGLVASAVRDNQRVILVVSGLNTKKEREEEPRKLLEWGFKSFKPYRLFDQGEKVSDALVWGGTRHYVPLVGNENIDIILPFNTSGQVTAQIVYDGPIKAPIRKGDQVATLRVTAADTKATNDIPLYAGEDVGQSNFAMRGLDSLFVLAFGWML